jgi:hypothetical protein
MSAANIQKISAFSMNVARFRLRSSVFVHGVSVGFPWGGLALLGVSDSIDNVCFRMKT